MSALHEAWYWIGRIPAILFDLPIDWPPHCRCSAGLARMHRNTTLTAPNTKDQDHG